MKGRPWRRRLLRALAGAAILALAAAAAKAVWDRVEPRMYNPRLAAHTVAGASERREGFRKETFVLRPDGQPPIPVTACLPDPGPGPHPAVVVLYGFGMRRKWAESLAAESARAGFALVTPEQFDCGDRRTRSLERLRRLLGMSPREMDLLRERAALRYRALRTLKETRWLLNAIERRPDLDADRLYVWGMSLGAMVACRAMAEDPRLQAGVLTLCGGDFPRMLRDSPYWGSLKPWEKAGAVALTSLMRPADPIGCVGRIAPRPLLFQNSRNDDLVPASCARALFRAAAPPKEMRWYDMGHCSPVPEEVAKAVSSGLAWLVERDQERGGGRGLTPAQAGRSPATREPGAGAGETETPPGSSRPSAGPRRSSRPIPTG